MKKVLLMMAGWLLTMTASAQGENKVYQFDKPLYGAAYYAEYTPTDRLDEDIRLMKEAGLTVVRVGESTWSLFEPQDGQFEFAWMDRIIDALHKAGIKVILGTPTYSIPSWLAAEHPEVLSQTWDGGQSHYGIRQNMDLLNATYRRYSERIIRKMMEHYAQHQPRLLRGLPRVHQAGVPWRPEGTEPPLGTELLGHEHQPLGGLLRPQGRDESLV